MVSEGVAVAAAGSVLRGSLRIGRAMAAAVALVGLLGAELLALQGARAIWSGFRARLGLETAGEAPTPRRVRDRAHCRGRQPAHDRALDGRLPGHPRQQPPPGR